MAMGNFAKNFALGSVGMALSFGLCGISFAEPKTAPMDPSTFEISTGPVEESEPTAAKPIRRIKLRPSLGAWADPEETFLPEIPLKDDSQSHSSEVSVGEIAEPVVPREDFSLVLPPGGKTFRMNARGGGDFELIPGRLWGIKEHPSLIDRYNFNGAPLFYPTDEVSIVLKTQIESLVALTKRMELSEECIRELVHYFAESYPVSRPELGQIPTMLSYYREVFDPAISYLDYRIAEIKESGPYIPAPVKAKKGLFSRRPSNLPEDPSLDNLKNLEKARGELVDSMSSQVFWADSIKEVALKVCSKTDEGLGRNVNVPRVLETLSGLEEYFFTKHPSGKTWQEAMNDMASLDRLAKAHKSKVKSEIFSNGEKQLREIYFHFYDLNEKVALLEHAHSAVKQATVNYAASEEAVRNADGMGAKLEALKSAKHRKEILAEANATFVNVREEALLQCLTAVEGLEAFQVPGLRTEKAPESFSPPRVSVSLPGANSFEAYNQRVLKPIQDRTKELYALLKMAPVNELDLDLDLTKLFFDKNHCADVTKIGGGMNQIEGLTQINVAYGELTRVLLELRRVGEVVDALSQKSDFEMGRVFSGAQQPFSEAVRRMELQESLPGLMK